LVLPVLFYEYLALSITKSLIPRMIVDYYGNQSYVAVGIIETCKGCLAFLACPVFGRLSDRIGRKYCLLVTMVGTTLPVCIMAFTNNMLVYAIASSVSGFFSATFPLTFAYISDCVADKKKRAPAYGLALATFGLSFCLGPVSGGYLAKQFGEQSVFISSLLLVIVNCFYIVLYLPETVKVTESTNATRFQRAMEYLPNTWKFDETFRVFRSDPFMSNLALIVFLYYTSVWALISTLIIHVTRFLGFSQLALGWLLSGYGLATMFSEAVLVRYIVPWLGETNSMRLGLLSFSAQCVVVALSSSPVMIFISVLFSMLANLVYPSISSLVSKIVDEDQQGEALGALNGIKALTEGFGPLVFGMLMALFENTPVPGAPYLLACILSMWAFLHCFELPPEPEVLVAKYRAVAEGGEDDHEGAALLSAYKKGGFLAQLNCDSADYDMESEVMGAAVVADDVTGKNSNRSSDLRI
jgi:DHA1 family tetracycline resistance protein-like MFS transporter